MRNVIQKVIEAQVIVDDKVVGEIKEGFMILVGIESSDTRIDVEKAADKIATMRIFEDEEGKINRSLKDVNGQILSVSQFTLCADIRKGNRPSFTRAMAPTDANDLFQIFNDRLRSHGYSVETGVFQTHMNVRLDNDGPVTIIMDVRDGKVL